jgi:predicted nucleic acid-binding protein
MIIVDTGFLSSLFKINRLELVKKHFEAEYIVMPYAVFEELSKTEFFAELIQFIAVNEDYMGERHWILLKKAEIEIDEEKLGMGEKEAISLAKKHNALLLIDDRTARSVAKSEGVMTATLPEFLLDCKDAHSLSKDDISIIIGLLAEKDFYKFRKDVFMRLKDCED